MVKHVENDKKEMRFQLKIQVTFSSSDMIFSPILIGISLSNHPTGVEKTPNKFTAT